MLLVLVVHADFFSLGVPTHEESITHPFSAWMRISIESLALVCVNVFIVISGYFGIKTTLKRVLNFAFMIIFWRFGVTAVMRILYATYGIGEPLSIIRMIKLCIPGFDDWFVSAYILLMFMAPMLNAFIEKTAAGHYGPSHASIAVSSLYFRGYPLYTDNFPMVIQYYRL